MLQLYGLSNLEMTLNCDEKLSVDSNGGNSLKICFTAQRIVTMLLLILSCCKLSGEFSVFTAE